MSKRKIKIGKVVEAKEVRSYIAPMSVDLPPIRGKVVYIDEEENLIAIETPDKTVLLLSLLDFIVQVIPLLKRIFQTIRDIFRK